MRTLKRTFLLQLVLVFSLATAACSDEKNGDDNYSNPPTSQVEIIITKDNGNEEVDSKSIALGEKEELLYDLMKEHFDIEGENGFITSINGIAQDINANQYWFFEVNGENAMKGASETNVQDGDQVKWDLHEADF